MNPSGGQYSAFDYHTRLHKVYSDGKVTTIMNSGSQAGTQCDAGIHPQVLDGKFYFFTVGGGRAIDCTEYAVEENDDGDDDDDDDETTSEVEPPTEEPNDNSTTRESFNMLVLLTGILAAIFN